MRRRPPVHLLGQLPAVQPVAGTTRLPTDQDQDGQQRVVRGAVGRRHVDPRGSGGEPRRRRRDRHLRDGAHLGHGRRRAPVLDARDSAGGSRPPEDGGGRRLVVGRQLHRGRDGGIGAEDGVDAVGRAEDDECGGERCEHPPPPAGPSPAQREQGERQQARADPGQHRRGEGVGPGLDDGEGDHQQAEQGRRRHDRDRDTPGPPRAVAVEEEQPEQSRAGAGEQGDVQRSVHQREPGQPAPPVHAVTASPPGPSPRCSAAPGRRLGAG